MYTNKNFDTVDDIEKCVKDLNRYGSIIASLDSEKETGVYTLKNYLYQGEVYIVCMANGEVLNCIKV